MIEKIEFYNTPDGSVCCKPEGKPMFILDESCRPLIEEMIVDIAFAAKRFADEFRLHFVRDQNTAKGHISRTGYSIFTIPIHPSHILSLSDRLL